MKTKLVFLKQMDPSLHVMNITAVQGFKTH